MGLSDVVEMVERVGGGKGEGGKVEVVQYPEEMKFVSEGRLCEVYFHFHFSFPFSFPFLFFFLFLFLFIIIILFVFLPNDPLLFFYFQNQFLTGKEAIKAGLAHSIGGKLYASIIYLCLII